MRRVAGVAAVIILLMVVGNVAAFWIFGADPGPGSGGFDRDRDGPGGFWVLPVLLLVAGGVAVGRTVRRSAGVLGDVMEAADRVAAGDNTARVPPRGPGEVRQLAVSFNAMADRLAEHDARRRALMADVAHELRTPLAVVRGRVEGMLDGVYPREDAQLEPLLDQVAVMTRLLEDLATLSTAEAGVLQLHREPIAPGRLIAEAAAAFAPQAEAAGIALTVAASDVGLAPIEVDPVRVGQVLDNLIANALRWTPAGGRIRVSADPDTTAGTGVAGEGAVVFAVEDTGPGIAPEELTRVFDRYAKSADSGGSGLGLAIARRLVEAHGGEIWAHSAVGAGTVIAFRLPPS